MPSRGQDSVESLRIENRRLRERLGLEKYIHYLSYFLDEASELHSTRADRFYRDVALFLQREWDADGFFIKPHGQSRADFLFGPDGREMAPEFRSMIEETAAICAGGNRRLAFDRMNDAPRKLKRFSPMVEALAAVPIFWGRRDDGLVLCILGLYRARRETDRRRPKRHRFKPFFFGTELTDEDRRLVRVARARIADRGGTAMTDAVPDILYRVADLAGVDNFIQSQRIRREDLELHLGRDLAGRVVSRPGFETRLKPRRKTAGHLFCDITDFSGIASRHRKQPGRVVRLLNRFLSVSQKVIQSYPGAVLDKYIGDCVVALIGALDDDRIEKDKTSPAYHRRLKEYARTGLDMGFELLEAAHGIGVRVSIGYHVGESLIGFVGPDKTEIAIRPRIDFTAVGHNMNLAARLQGAARADEIAVSEAVQLVLAGGRRYRFSPPRQVEFKNIGNENVFSVTRP